MSKKKHRQYTPEGKVAILRQHLLEGKTISEVCEANKLQPRLGAINNQTGQADPTR